MILRQKTNRWQVCCDMPLSVLTMFVELEMTCWCLLFLQTVDAWQAEQPIHHHLMIGGYVASPRIVLFAYWHAWSPLLARRLQQPEPAPTPPPHLWIGSLYPVQLSVMILSYVRWTVCLLKWTFGLPKWQRMDFVTKFMPWLPTLEGGMFDDFLIIMAVLED